MVVSAQDIKEFYQQNRTLTHQEAILNYKRLEKAYPESCRLITKGETDVGKPLHLFVLDESGQFDPAAARKSNKSILLINNAIHPGEPCGVDACLTLSRLLLENKEMYKYLEDVAICIIPMYNLGGALNRSCCSRANQMGPEQYGFRGNYQNLDLNRDFIKCDSKNAFAFVDIFQEWDPDVFVDTHTSNGADYQHIMTLITSQLDKMAEPIAKFTEQEFEPALYKHMKEVDYPMCPYAHSVGKTPDSGIKDYLETPRYSTGYTNLFHTISFVSETHMLKPYEERVEATLQFLNGLIEFMAKNKTDLFRARNTAKKESTFQMYFPIQWELDTTNMDSILFHGYESGYKPSTLTGADRLFYDRDQPYSKYIPWYRNYPVTDSVKAPKYYVVPQAWEEVIRRLQSNRVKMIPLQKDTSIEVTVYYIEDYETVKQPYEAHYLHYEIETTKKVAILKYYRGDYLIPVNQISNRFIVETLEPRAVDSYFAWNFFDGILQQKEWYSPYVFEDRAVEILEENPELKKRFDQRKANDPSFANNPRMQLYFVYKSSPYYEPTHNRYPVTRIE